MRNTVWARLCMVVCACFTPAHLSAVIHGLPIQAHSSATLRLQIQHEHYLRSLGTWEYYESTCSGVIVGIHPLTVLTAAHCLKEVRLAERRNLPMINIDQAKQSGLTDVTLKQAYYRPYEAVEDDLTMDIAVLIFDAKIAPSVTYLPVITEVAPPEQLMICGYGRGTKEEELRQPRCAQRPVLQPDEDFSKFLPMPYQADDEMLYLKSQAQFAYTRELLHNEQALLAVNRLNQQHKYDPSIEIPTVGDSGGPWLSLGQNSALGVYAITSLVERFYNQSKHWPFFDKDIPLIDYPYVAYGLRLSHPLVLHYLEFAKNSGADIRFITPIH